MVSLKSFYIEDGGHILSTFWKISFNSLFSDWHLLNDHLCLKIFINIIGVNFQNEFYWSMFNFVYWTFLQMAFIYAQTLAIKTLIHIRTLLWRAVIHCCLSGACFGVLTPIFCDVGCSVPYFILVRYSFWLPGNVPMQPSAEQSLNFLV